MNDTLAYATIKKAITDSSFRQAVLQNADAVLQKEGWTDAATRQELKDVLMALPGKPEKYEEYYSRLQKEIYSRQQKETADLNKAFRDGLKTSQNQIELGFKLSLLMYNVAFYLGVLLIAASALLGVVRNETVLPLVFGGLGMADIVAFFITRPPQQLQSSRADLAQLQLGFYNWFMDNVSWTWYVNYLWDFQADPDILRKRMAAASDKMLENTSKTMDLIEKYCEFDKDKKGKDSGGAQEGATAQQATMTGQPAPVAAQVAAHTGHNGKKRT